MKSMSQKRVLKDYEDIIKNFKEQFKVELKDNDINTWFITFNGAKGTVYESETFQLRIKFDDKFPLDAPEVIFVGCKVPEHPHIYSNGFICLSILYDAWSPSLKISSVCLSILSMLSSCKKKKKPTGDKEFVKSCKETSPKDVDWEFHDDKV